MVAIEIASSVMVLAISAAVGLYLMRFRERMTEMTGMMVGMTMGMITGILVGYFVGVVTDMFISNTVGIVVGIAFGAGFGVPGRLMGIMDGAMGGLMGGMMGAMLGVMINVSPLAVWGTQALLMVIYVAVLAALIRLVTTACSRRGVIDPVCRMSVEPTTARWSSTYQGQIYYFCAPACKREFDAAPESFCDGALGMSPAI